jgi:protein-S-isoprenylcysteine O-methyltransferase Ste14
MQESTALPYSPPSPAFRRAPLSLIQDFALVVYCVLTVWAHSQEVLDGRFVSVGFLAEQSFLVVLFLTRRQPMVTSARPLDWVVAIGGWLSLAMRPVGSESAGLELGGAVLQLVGLSCTLVAFSYMGRSFGIVAANRGLKVNGPYRIVRHPIYFAHAITITGFLLANPSMLNLGLFVLIGVCQLLRINAEERVLNASSDYGSYAERVRWRLVPWVY